jgi:hypothetical protein
MTADLNRWIAAKLLTNRRTVKRWWTAFVAKETGLPVLALANQAGSVSGVENWLAMIQYNVLALTKGLENKK